MMNLGDNYVTGDNVYLRELQNFFFEVLGMMSITHYGAIGDGRTDNYGPLQVAIDDAHRRGLSYLYVPYGRFIYTGELINLEGITFVGNPHAHIVNIRTGEEIEILQFGVNGSLVDVYTKTETDELLSEKQGTLTAGENITITDENVISATGGSGGGTMNAMTAYLTPTSTQMTSISVKLPFDESVSFGTGFTLNNGEIVIGPGITKIMVTGQVKFVTSTAGNTIDVDIHRYSTATTSKAVCTGEWCFTGEGEDTATLAPCLIDVSEGDKIRMFVVAEGEYVGGSTSIPSTYLTVVDMTSVSGGSGGDDAFYTTLETDITCAQDGTVTPALADGFYFLKDGNKISYYAYGGTTEDDYSFGNSLIYYSSVGAKTFRRLPVTWDATNGIEYALIYNSSYQYWSLSSIDYMHNAVHNLNSSELCYTRNSIPTTGDDKHVPTIQAVRDYVASQGGGGGTPDMIGLALSANHTGSKTNGMTFSTVTNIGTSFTLSNDGVYVTVGNGVNYIDVSFGVYFNKAADGAANCTLNLKAKRGVEETTVFLTKSKEKISNSGDHTISHASQIVPVQAGDKIYLNSLGFDSGDTTYSEVDSSKVTYLTIKKVG